MSQKPHKSFARARIEVPTRKKIAFVCSGGAAKAGAFHLGVALALQEKGFHFVGGLARESPLATAAPKRPVQVYVGSSAGSLICSYLASGYALDEIFDSFLGKRESTASGRGLKRLNYRTMFNLGLTFSLGLGGLRRLLKSPGLFSTAGIEKYLREDVLPANDFQSYQADLFIVATQLNHSRKVVFGKYREMAQAQDKTVVYMNNTSVSQACAASTALPLIFSPYPINNEKGVPVHYFDGEIRDTLSTHVGSDAGADLIISSYTHQPYHFSREIGSIAHHGIPTILIQALYLMIERKIQNAMTWQQRASSALELASAFLKEHQVDAKASSQFLDTLEERLGYKRNVVYVHIHPSSSDHEMFFGDHFNLSSKKMTEVVKIGFRSAINTLRKYDFAD
jgi:predicted acylesterase/phospholipase RssA